MPWNAIQYVTSGLTLTAFLAAVVLALYRHKLRSRERLIDSVPENERAALVQATLERFDVDTTRLTKQQAYDLALEQIRGRSRRYMINVGLVCLLGLFTFVVFLVNWLQARPETVIDADRLPDLAKFCRDHSYIGVVNTRAEMGGGADYWECQPGEHKGIVVAQACLEQFGEQFSRAVPDSTKMPYQWVCRAK